MIEEEYHKIYSSGKVLEKGKYIIAWKIDKNKWEIYRSILNKDSN